MSDELQVWINGTLANPIYKRLLAVFQPQRAILRHRAINRSTARLNAYNALVFDAPPPKGAQIAVLYGYADE